jgi:hypothetical protein
LNEFVATLVRWLLRAVVLAMGLVVFLSLLAAAMLLGLVWALRAGWARLTGRPMAPWVMRVDPRTGFHAAMRSTGPWGGARSGAPGGGSPDETAAPSRRGGVLPGSVDVTDVEPRELR